MSNVTKYRYKAKFCRELSDPPCPLLSLLYCPLPGSLVPSAGHRLQVKEQSSSAVLLVWEHLPVEEQHGFITQYSLYCQKESSATRGFKHTQTINSVLCLTPSIKLILSSDMKIIFEK